MKMYYAAKMTVSDFLLFFFCAAIILNGLANIK